MIQLKSRISFVHLPWTFAGTAKINNLAENNIDSLKEKLTEDNLKEISDAVTIEEMVAGGISFQKMDHFHWKFANYSSKKIFLYLHMNGVYFIEIMFW